MRFVFPVLLTAVSLSGGLPGQETKTDLDKLQGRWTVAAMERDGRAAPKEYCDRLLITIAGDKMMLGFKEGKGPEVNHQIKLDPKNPKVMDLVVPTGRDKGKVLLGIYDFDGKTLKMCHTDAGAEERPTEYKSPSGKFLSVTVLVPAPK
ncbi:MAG: TIGR03067 domain-containing protein [Gemmataceae bacterium]|nr:TIGR03067 domain-containing protein [Gemmataceae bacterium]